MQTTRILISTRNLAETKRVLAAGIDLIDLKNPAAGSLGRPEWDLIRQVADECLQSPSARPPADVVPHRSSSTQLELSVALGELLDLPADFDLDRGLRGFRYAKVGLAGCSHEPNWPEKWLDFSRRLPIDTQPVLVHYADWEACQAPRWEAVCEVGYASQATVLLIDTCHKRGRGLFDCLSIATLCDRREQIRGRFRFALAGSLQLRDQPQLRAVGPDIVGLRSAVCRQNRTGDLDPQRLAAWIDFSRRRLAPAASQNVCR